MIHTGPIEFKATLGESREPHQWYLAASRAVSREKVTVQLTGEEVARILGLENVRIAIKELFGITFATHAEAQETIRQLTERVATLQRVCDDTQRPRTLGEHDAKCQQEIWGMFDKNMSFGQIRDEIARLLKHDKNIQRVAAGARVQSRFDEALVVALREPTLADALNIMATWDNERAVRQALRNVGPDARTETSHGGLWDTTFKYCFERVLAQWRPGSVNDAATEKIAGRERSAASLWRLLDDIDSLADAIKPDTLEDYKRLHQRALHIALQRHKYLKTDGYKLTWPDGETAERKSNYMFTEIPEHDPAIYAKYEDLKLTVERALGGEQFMAEFPGHADLGRRIARLRTTAAAARAPKARDVWHIGHTATAVAPVPMLLYCPMCHGKHIDEGEFATRSHHTHACQGYVSIDGTGEGRRRCGHVWRPAIVPTVGVETLPGFLNDPVPANVNPQFPSLSLGNLAAIQRIDLMGLNTLNAMLVRDSELTLVNGQDSNTYWLTFRQDVMGNHKVKFTNLNTEGGVGPTIPTGSGSDVVLQIHCANGQFFLQGETFFDGTP